ncbi:uncharacterized protein [Dysidea avara]|uniref:uncharacterized protein n=1 Tax=Dysidea avara TaxID=196820 RepID=UPI00332CB1F2
MKTATNGSGKYTPSQDSALIDALRDLKVKQEELCKNERMTRKKMITSMRAIQDAKLKEINEVREKERIAAQLKDINHQQLLQMQSSKKEKLDSLNTKLDSIEKKEAELQSHLEQLEEQFLQQHQPQFAAMSSKSSTPISNNVSKKGTPQITSAVNTKYGDKFRSLSRLDEEQLRLEAELESVRRELETYNFQHNSRTAAVLSRHHSPAHYSPQQHHHSDTALDQRPVNSANYNRPVKRRGSSDALYGHQDGGDRNWGPAAGGNPYYGPHMMQVMLDQQAKVYSKESELLRREMEQLKDIMKDVARNRSHHHTPQPQQIFQPVPAPLHPSYLNYPFPNYPPPPGVPVPPGYPPQPNVLPPTEPSGRTRSRHHRDVSHSSSSSSQQESHSRNQTPEKVSTPATEPAPPPVTKLNVPPKRKKGLLASLLNKKGATISSVPPSRNRPASPLKLEVIDEDSMDSDNVSTDQVTIPVDVQSTRSAPKPATPKTPTKDDITSNIGIQLQYLKGVPSGTASVEVKGHERSGLLVKTTKKSMVDHKFEPVEDKYVYSLHHFGFQTHEFTGVPVMKKLILMIRVYHSAVTAQSSDDNNDVTENLICWTCVGLTTSNNNNTGESTDEQQSQVNSGCYELPLFKPPVCKLADAEPDPERCAPGRSQQYGTALIGIAIYIKDPPKPFANLVLEHYEPEVKYSSAWVDVRRTAAPSQQFLPGDGFFLYVDGARYLPDSVTVSRVVGRLLNYAGIKVGQDITSVMHPDSNKYCPNYSLRQLFYEDNFPPTATAILKIYTLDKDDPEKLMIVGYTVLNIFVESGSITQPIKDDVASTLSLNEGCFQLRIYHGSPNPELDYNVHMFDNHRSIPCASLLVRLERVPAEKIHSAKNASADFVVPNYNTGVYTSESCTPTISERLLFDYVARHRKVITIREAAVELFGAADVQLYGNDKNFCAVLKGKLTRQVAQTPTDLGCLPIAPYDITHGFMVSVEHADNLTWKKFAHVIFFCSPPAFYLEKQLKDFIFHTSKIGLNSQQRSPSWSDGFVHIEHRVYHSYMVMIFIVQSINMASQGKKFTLGSKMWTPLQVFSDGFVHTDKFQLPLYHGIPNKRMIELLSSHDCHEVMREARSSHSVKLTDGATLTVKISDSRRCDELKEPFPVNPVYMPIKSKTKHKGVARPLRELLPSVNTEERKFQEDMLESFKEQILKFS